MKVVNVMNFVRQCDFRLENSEELLYHQTEKELELVNQYQVENTFLLQYDALIDERYIRLFQTKATERTELGLWFEVVKPLTDAVGLPWRGRAGTTWDWHIVPGFLMAYTHEEQEKLIDEAMERFRKIYGYYPKTVASWLLDSYAVAYMSDHYDISAFAICRDQTATDAYTLVGGYFNQAYYPSRNNMFTPAQTEEYRIHTPMFRLLGSDPIHNYDNEKYITDPKYLPYHGCYTLEAVWRSGSEPELIKWFFDSYFRQEDLGFSYAQIGQENSFAEAKVITSLDRQLEILKEYPEVQLMKMCDTGELFRTTYQTTPATAVCALTDWEEGKDVQSVYYDCRNYVANLFRYKNRIFLRGLYLFDERIRDDYYDAPCDTWDATYENLPVVDTLLWEDDNGLLLDDNADPFDVKKTEEGVLQVFWGEKSVTFSENQILLNQVSAELDPGGSKADIVPHTDRLDYSYKGNHYSLCVKQGSVSAKDGRLQLVPDQEEMVLSFRR